MSGPIDTIIYADWGNSSGRLFHVDQEGRILDRAKVPGVIKCEDPAVVFDQATKGWAASNSWLCGAITSNIGWINTGYCDATAPISDWIKSAQTMERNGRKLTFLPGLKTDANCLGYFDTMRGEDILMFGCLELNDAVDGILCMPGTHSKWVKLTNGRYDDLLTGLSGELFNILKQHSILTGGVKHTDKMTDAFWKGVAFIQGAQKPSLNHMLMAVRTMQISGELSHKGSADFLSGLIIGEDCHEAIRHFGHFPVTIIGGQNISERYAAVLEKSGVIVATLSDEDCIIAGFNTVRPFQT